MEKYAFISFLGLLEFNKTIFRGFHWESELKSEHVLCDDIIGAITEFQDSFAEEGFSFFGKISKTEFIDSVKENNITDDLIVMTALQSLLVEVMYIKKETSNDIQFCGLSALCDEFIHKIRKFMTLTTYK